MKVKWNKYFFEFFTKILVNKNIGHYTLHTIIINPSPLVFFKLGKGITFTFIM